jgi:hypothetical protein
LPFEIKLNAAWGRALTALSLGGLAERDVVIRRVSLVMLCVRLRPGEAQISKAPNHLRHSGFPLRLLQHFMYVSCMKTKGYFALRISINPDEFK